MSELPGQSRPPLPVGTRRVRATIRLMHRSKQHLVAVRRASASRSCCRAKLPRSPCRALLVPLLMGGAEVRKLLENVGVRFQTAGRAFALGQEREAVINHVVSEDAAVGILRRLRRIETQH